MGIESDTATGWPATDWFEDLIMRYGGADVYNQWVTNEVKFDSDVVREAAAEFEELMFTEGNVLGGRKAISSTNFGTGGNPMFDEKPGCYLYKQGSFITGFFPESVTADLDANVGVFGFPPVEGGENPVLGGGDLAVLMSDSEAAADVMAMLSETDIGNDAAPSSSFISPHKDFDAQPVPERDSPGRWPTSAYELVGVPLRRVRPDAGRGRRRVVLEGDDRVDLRPAGPGHHAEEDRRELAQLTS